MTARGFYLSALFVAAACVAVFLSFFIGRDGAMQRADLNFARFYACEVERITP